MTEPSPASTHDLVLTRFIDAPPERLFEGWTKPELMKRWFTPPPFRTVHVETDLRPGGASLVMMEGPDGTQYPNRGVYLEVVPNRRIVFTDAYTSAWVPSAKPFMTAIISFEPEGRGTRYTAIVRHWSEEDRRKHEEMGFHTGWGIAADQLEALVTER